jgi:hypothetical protein
MEQRSVIDGIKRRLDGTDQLHDGTYYWLDDILADNGLPSINSHTGGFDPDYIGFLSDVAELLERLNDAANANSDAEVSFIERQIDALIDQARQRWSVSK